MSSSLCFSFLLILWLSFRTLDLFNDMSFSNGLPFLFLMCFESLPSSNGLPFGPNLSSPLLPCFLSSSAIPPLVRFNGSLSAPVLSFRWPLSVPNWFIGSLPLSDHSFLFGPSIPLPSCSPFERAFISDRSFKPGLRNESKPGGFPASPGLCALIGSKPGGFPASPGLCALIGSKPGRFPASPGLCALSRPNPWGFPASPGGPPG
ncbi:uncharacterized protein NEMAJ01_1938 [Nematocida major]|uniref:uncharacterized protein n=1 Tax=Nematocida major TaxID=1912982 RepID=UPI0020081C69|nr:uncharacterized protein NEMAJ01_1938 [Nematocida major]KAH9387042.1 hypothetical protein NEMAJ01_1938 [Nematocida major]